MTFCSQQLPRALTASRTEETDRRRRALRESARGLVQFPRAGGLGVGPPLTEPCLGASPVTPRAPCYPRAGQTAATACSTASDPREVQQRPCTGDARTQSDVVPRHGQAPSAPAFPIPRVRSNHQGTEGVRPVNVTTRTSCNSLTCREPARQRARSINIPVASEPRAA